MTKITIADATVEVLPTGTLIKYADGTLVPGEPEDTDTYRQTAQRYGYGSDTLGLCIDHEIVHVALGAWLGVDSPTMRAVRQGHLDDDVALRRLEEAAVLAVQQYARAAGVNLIERWRD
jgi:hypothetical protein